MSSTTTTLGAILLFPLSKYNAVAIIADERSKNAYIPWKNFAKNLVSALCREGSYVPERHISSPLIPIIDDFTCLFENLRSNTDITDSLIELMRSIAYVSHIEIENYSADASYMARLIYKNPTEKGVLDVLNRWCQNQTERGTVIAR